MKKPMIDVAFDIMTKRKKGVNFVKLWEEICKETGLTEAQAEDRIADFYTDLSLDDRFVHLSDNKWDLKSRHKYDEVVVDTSAILIDENDDDILELEGEEETSKESAEETY